LWGLVSIQHFGTLLFATLSLFFLSREKPIFLYISLFFAVLATFTFGNGFIVFISGSILLFFQNRRKELYIWGLILFTTLFLFFLNHNTPKSQYAIYYNPLDFAIYFFSLLGNSVISTLETYICLYG